MAERIFIKGNDALAFSALRAGLNFFAGYPITPASEIPEYLARAYQADQIRLQNGKKPRYPDYAFIQAESEIASINMVLGAAATGARAMTASSSPGMTLKMEGISYLHGSELPAVVIDVMRGGPGLGNIAPEQSDYHQITRGGGHGTYRNIVLAPAGVQDMFDIMPRAFDLAFRYRTVAVVLIDGCLGQMQESITLHDVRRSPKYEVAAWALDDNPDRERRVITSLRIEPEALEKHVNGLQAKYDLIARNEPEAETHCVEDAEVVCVAYGICARIAKGAVNELRAEGVRAGLIRPVTLWPYPTFAIQAVCQTARAFLSVELSTGQMIDDVRLAVEGARPVAFYGRTGGVLPSETEIVNKVLALKKRYC